MAMMPQTDRPGESWQSAVELLHHAVDGALHQAAVLQAGGQAFDFDDEGGWAAYRDHPDHQQIIRDEIAPRLASRVATQFELPT